jgi:predicted peroxiredoxin
MAKYLLIESRDRFESQDDSYWQVALDLRKAGNDVTLFFVQNGVLTTRRGPKTEGLSEIKDAGVTVLADDFSLRERGITKDRMVEGIEISPLDIVIDQMADGAKTIWH